MDVFWAAPLVTRTLTALTLLQSGLVYGGLLSFYYSTFVPSQIFSWPPELYRLVTPFLLTRPGLGLLFDLYFMFRYGSDVEKSMAPGEFFIYVLFVAFNLMLTAGSYLGAYVLTSPLIMAFVYTYSQKNRGTKTRFFFIDIPTVALPYAMLVVELLSHGWFSALIEGMGLVAAHLYDFLTRIYPTFGGGRNFIFVPACVQRFFMRHDPNYGDRGYGSATYPSRPANQPSSASASGSSFGRWTTSDPWSARGAGRKLG